MKIANCEHCGVSYRYHPHHCRGRFCSNACRGLFIVHANKEKIERGLIRNPSTLRKYLLTTRKNECEKCGTGTVWNGIPLSLQMDHTDGNSDNNKLDNLRLLCPNCHTQTETWCGRGKKAARRNRYLKKWKAKQVVGGDGLEPPTLCV